MIVETTQKSWVGDSKLNEAAESVTYCPEQRAFVLIVVSNHASC